MKELVQRFDYKGAVILSDTPNYPRDDIYTLKRTDAAYFTIGNEYHEGLITAELAGINHMVRCKIGSMRTEIEEVIS